MIAPNLPALVSTSVATVGYVCAAFTALLARAPGMKSLRAFAVCAALGAIFATTNALAFTSRSPDAVVGYLRVGLLAAALHGASWLTYAAVREGRPLQPIEKILIAGGCVFGLGALVPGAMLESEVWIRRVEWLGISYNDAKTTTLGSVACTYYCSAMLLPLWRGIRRFGQSGAAERAEVVGLALLVLAGVNDSIASLGYQTPYVLDVGFLLLVVSVGGTLAKKFVDNARTVEATAIELREAQAELVRRERLAALGEMSAVVAHEVRNPVAIIFNALASVKRHPEEGEALLGIVHEEAERLKRMVSDLLEFARPQSLHFTRTSLEPVVAGAVEAVAATTSNASDIEVTTTDLPPVLCDTQLVRQALVNLVTNALQARGRKRPVRVNGEVRGESVVLAVVDDGDGVPSESRSQIFQPFFTTRATGTGLGLRVVQRIAEAHGGRIVHLETPGGGATFELFLPIHGEGPASA